MNTVILDYGMGNLRSVQKAVEFLGFPASIQSDLEGAERLIIPGVGAFGTAMERIGPLAPAIRHFVASGRPLLGICLGQQLLFEQSEELGAHEGLGIVPGEVLYLPRDLGLKVPNIGWSSLEVAKSDGLLKGVEPGAQVYFVHSLYTRCADPRHTAATAAYGIPFPAAIQMDNVWGCQFHPEKSGDVGLGILQNFLNA